MISGKGGTPGASLIFWTTKKKKFEYFSLFS